MKSVIKGVVLVPFAVVFLVFAVSNRADVQVVIDPFGLIDGWAKLSLPLFLVMSFAAMLGVIIGGFGTWWSQRRMRDRLRQCEAERDELRRDIMLLRSRSATALSANALTDKPNSRTTADSLGPEGSGPVSMIT